MVTYQEDKLPIRDIVLTACAPRVLKVRVTDTAGSPVRNASVNVYSGSYPGWGRGGTRYSDANGEIAYDLYEGGSYTIISVERDGFCYVSDIRNRQPKLPEVGGDDWTGIFEARMEPLSRTVKGRVEDPSGKPVPFARMEQLYGPSATADAGGEFTIELPESSVTLHVREGDLYGGAEAKKGDVEIAIKLRSMRE